MSGRLPRIRRWSVVAIICVAAMMIPSVALAHPLGNFTINHYVGIHITEDQLNLEYVVDMAEIPAFSAIRGIDADDSTALDRYAFEACTEYAAGLTVSLDGERLDLEHSGSQAATPPGNAGVPTLRVACSYRTEVGPGTLMVFNANFEDRIGWREMVATSQGVAISTDLPSGSSSARLTAYPEDQLASPPDVRQATVVIGHGTVTESTAATPAPVTALGSLVQVESLGLGTSLIAIGAALALGTGHALAPGHGKTVVAAYLVGSRGTARQAIVLALATALSHTLGVAVLGVIAATATVTFEPAIVYPYLSTVAGLVVFGIGARLMWRLIRRTSHHHDHGHEHPHPPPTLGWKAVAALGLSGGLVPSASAVVLLLGAIHIGQAWFGIVLVAAFGIGMSVALVGSGLLAVLAQRMGWKLLNPRRSSGRLALWIPRAAAGAVVALGAAMTVSAFANLPIVG